MLITQTLGLLTGTAVAVGIFHTVLGVDHYLPFIVMGRAQGWPLRKSMTLTFICGLAHVSSAVLLGLGGIGLGVTIQRLQVIHNIQGNIAAWFLIAFGLTYAAWSFAGARRNQGQVPKKAIMTTWTLLVIFVLGPCEPLVPLMIVPALQHGIRTAMWVAAVFSATTISCMLVLVVVGWYGLNRISLRQFEVHAHTFAGLTLAAAGAAMQLLKI